MEVKKIFKIVVYIIIYNSNSYIFSYWQYSYSSLLSTKSHNRNGICTKALPEIAVSGIIIVSVHFHDLGIREEYKNRIGSANQLD